MSPPPNTNVALNLQNGVTNNVSDQLLQQRKTRLPSITSPITEDSNPLLIYSNSNSNINGKTHRQSVSSRTIEHAVMNVDLEKWNEIIAMAKTEQLDDSVPALQRSFVWHTLNTVVQMPPQINLFGAYQSAAHCVRDRLLEQWNQTQKLHASQSSLKRVYYMSLEFLMGRSLDNSIAALGLKGSFAEAVRELGMRLEDLIDQEKDAALGNGGLGRLAACFMDSLATGQYPAWGYGLRYTYGIFRQGIREGYQVEFPDYWLTFDNPWEVARLDSVYEVRLYGKYDKTSGWTGGEKVLAVAYDVPVPGFHTRTCANIRLWSSKPRRQFDLQSFNAGNYQASVQEQQMAEQITSVLYPNDNTMQGKELRLKQQYFFVSATMQDILARFTAEELDKGKVITWTLLPERVAIQLNDTHPSLAIPELMRLLMDQEGLDWDLAWSLTTRIFSFTNHTVLPEAMEKWPLTMLSSMLPRLFSIILDINLFFLQEVERRFPGDRAMLTRMSIVEEGPTQQVRMAHLAIIGSHAVNGVAELHSKLIRETVFADFVKFFKSTNVGVGSNAAFQSNAPGFFQNKTNGITPRRWLHQANPGLSALITEILHTDKWLVNLDMLDQLKNSAENKSFQHVWHQVKRECKQRLLTRVIMNKCRDQLQGALIEDVDEWLFDVQVKRIHEYKRQLMNALHVIYKYLELGANSDHHTNHQGSASSSSPPPPPRRRRLVMLGGKAAPGYTMAKLVIKLINSISQVINADPQTRSHLLLFFIPDYNVSLAELIIPGSDMSQHISTAGTEASGTSNMKFALNGGLLLGTLDGATIEIKQAAGEESCFIFGAKAEEVEDLRHEQRYHPGLQNESLSKVIAAIKSGMFGDPEPFMPLLDSLNPGSDYYLINHDFPLYLEAQARVENMYFENRQAWLKASIMTTASMGKFSSDRTIAEYARDIWGIKLSFR